MNKSLSIKSIQNISLYNLLQDLRHLVLIQVSQNEKRDHIRNSFFIDLSTVSKETLLELLNDEAEKAKAQEAKYKQQQIRRICFIDYGPLSEAHPKLSALQTLFEDNKELQTYKLYCLKDGMDSFSEKYPFLCLNEKDYNKEKGGVDNKVFEIDAESVRNNLLNSKEKKLLYSFSQFPFEIVENELFLGNVYHSNSKAYLEDLKVKTMIDFTLYSEEANKKIPQFKQQEPYTYKNIPLDPSSSVELDFDEINVFIDEALKNNPNTSVLLYCTNGQTLSPAFAIAYLMYKKKMNLQLASIKVFAHIGKVDIAKWVYTQLMLYNPKK